MSKVTDAMYEAGLNYLKGRGTAWCVSDLYKAMSAAKVADEIGTLINHEHEPHCCGCWVIRYDDAGLNAVCNECGETRDLIALLAQPEDGAILTEVLRRCAEYHGDDAILDAPCVFCGYNGPEYWQKGSHAESCRWHKVGGFDDRMKSLRRSTPQHGDSK